MTPEAQRIAIAKHCGLEPWVECSTHGEVGEQRRHGGSGQKYCPWCGNDLHQRELPDYLNDLDAIHEAEKTLSADDRELYATWLSNVALGHGSTLMSRKEQAALISATPQQRATAFLKTIGKWEEK